MNWKECHGKYFSSPLEWPPNLSNWRDWYWAATQVDQSNTPLPVLNAGVAIDGQLKSRSARLKEYTEQPPLALKSCLPRRKSPCYPDMSTWGTWSTWLAFKSSSHSIEVNVHLMCLAHCAWTWYLSLKHCCVQCWYSCGETWPCHEHLGSVERIQEIPQVC